MHGEQLMLLRRHLALYNHDLIMDGPRVMVYCAICARGAVYPRGEVAGPGIIGQAALHQLECHDIRQTRAHGD